MRATFATVVGLLTAISTIVAQSAPEKVKDVAPVYPRGSLDRGDEGMVLVELRVAPDGAVESALVLKSGCERLNEAALETARQWRFEPRTINGRQTAFKVLTVVPFRLGAKAPTTRAADACVWRDIRPIT